MKSTQNGHPQSGGRDDLDKEEFRGLTTSERLNSSSLCRTSLNRIFFLTRPGLLTYSNTSPAAEHQLDDESFTRVILAFNALTDALTVDGFLAKWEKKRDHVEAVRKCETS